MLVAVPDVRPGQHGLRASPDCGCAAASSTGRPRAPGSPRISPITGWEARRRRAAARTRESSSPAPHRENFLRRRRPRHTGGRPCRETSSASNARTPAARSPRLLPGPRLERAEAAIDRRADEDRAAGRRDAAADVQSAGLVETLRFQRFNERRTALSTRLRHGSRRAQRARRTAARNTESSSQDSRIADRAAPGLRRTQVVGPPPRAVPCTIFATWPMFMTLVNARPSVGSYEKSVPVAAAERARERHHRAVDAGWRVRALRCTSRWCPRAPCSRPRARGSERRSPSPDRRCCGRAAQVSAEKAASATSLRPGTVLCGTGRSSMPKIGSPVTRSKMNTSAHLRHHGDRGNRPAVALDVDQRRSGRHIVVPEVVVDKLLVPLQLAGGRIERDQRVAVQVRALTIAAVVVGRRRTERRVDDTALDVDGEERPDVGADRHVSRARDEKADRG